MNNSISSAVSFTSEQKEYLQGFFTGVAMRGQGTFAGQTSAGLITNDPADAVAEEMVFNTPVADLCKEERWKHEQNPFEIWDKLLDYAARNEPPTESDRFRIKYFGMFHVAPAQDSFMLRLRVPGGILSSDQMRGLATMAEKWGSGRADLTTRSNIQIREIAPKDIINVLSTLQKLGLTSRGSGADNIRNITASPITGLDPQELLDVAPLAEALQLYISNSRDMYELPRKFNVAFDNGGAISVLADTNDIGFTAVRVGGGRDVPAGVYFRVLLCGITGHKQFASDGGILLRPDQAVAVAVAMIRVFAEHGDRTDRKKARLKYLVDRWGVERFIAETEKKLAFPLIRVAIHECEPRGPIDRAGHIGIHAQKQAALNYVGVTVPVGRLPVSQMRVIAKLADMFGSGEVRLTVWQNLLIPNIRTIDLQAVERALKAAGLECTAGTVLSGTVACTGNRGCKFAATDTKTHAIALASQLDDRFPELDRPVNLHVTGCNHSCAQHYVGDIGLMGVKVGGEDGYQVVIGGGADQDRGVARELISAVKFSALGPKLESLFTQYTAQRETGESFLSFTRRHEIAQLQSYCNTPEAN